MCVGLSTSSFRRVRLASTVHLAVNPKFGLHCQYSGSFSVGWMLSSFLGWSSCFASTGHQFQLLEFIRSYSSDGSQVRAANDFPDFPDIYVTEIW